MSGLRDYRWLEFKSAPWRAGVAALLVGFAAVAGCHWLIPRLPAPAIELMRIGFRLGDMAGVVLFNDYAAVYFFAFFAGLVGLLGVVVVPREERRLEVLLVKPVPADTLLAARTWPVLAMAGIVGLGISMACAAAAWELRGGVTPLAAFGAGSMMTALVVIELAVLGVVFVRTTDTMLAVLLALLTAIAPLMPTATFLYRPDLFVGHEALTAVIVSGNLVWYGETMSWLGPVGLVVAGVVAAGTIRVGGRRLARAGV